MKNLNLKINDFIAIYTDIDNDSFGLGKVLAIDEFDLIISSVDPYGCEDGLILYNIDSIYKIEKNTQYCEKIKEFMDKKRTELSKYKFGSEKILYELLDLAKKNKKFVDIQLLNYHKSNSFGYVKFFDEDICEIQQIDYYGKEDGICVFSTDDITSVKYDSLEDRILEFLV